MFLTFYITKRKVLAPPDLVNVFFIEPKSDHFVCPCHSLTHIVETWLIYDTGNVNSKHLGVVGVTNVDVEERVDGCLGEILRMFGRDFKPEFCKDIKAEVWPTFWSWLLVNILRLKFDWNSEAELLSRFWFWSWSSVEILRLKFGIDSKAEFCC